MNNRAWKLHTPVDLESLPTSEHFELVEHRCSALAANSVRVKTLFLGTSPAQRAYVSQGASMHLKVNAGEVMRGMGVGVVIESNSNRFTPGQVVRGNLGWQTISDHQDNNASFTRLMPVKLSPNDAHLALSILGNAAYTAYFGLTDVGQCKSTDIVAITAAAGGVGSSAVQIAKALGCEVLGVASSSEKCRWLSDTLGADHTIAYQEQELESSLSVLCPNGVDVLFDNVGGQQLDTLLQCLRQQARVVLCGYIATDYNASPSWQGLKNHTQLLSKRATLQGFFVFDYFEQFSQADAQLLTWFEQGLLQDNADIVKGLENMPSALCSLFTGNNMGVRLCEV